MTARITAALLVACGTLIVFGAWITSRNTRGPLTRSGTRLPPDHTASIVLGTTGAFLILCGVILTAGIIARDD